MRFLFLLALVAGLAATLVVANRHAPPLPDGACADRVLLEKSQRRLTLFDHGAALKSYRVALGRRPVGAKEREGDRRTPEGRYVVTVRHERTAFHRALRVSYPNDADRARAVAGGWSPGGDIEIHGMRPLFGWVGRLHQFVDWTTGCIALTNSEMDELVRAVPDGTPLEIVP